jgi:AcrR family transcriptional regulator
MQAVAVEKLTPERRRQMTREALIAAAADVFAQKGFYGASLEEIAEAAGFTRGAIYSNFGSKDELLLAVIDMFIDRQIADLSELIQGEAGADPVASAMAAAAVWQNSSSLTPNWSALSLELRLSALRNPEVRKRFIEAERQSVDKVTQLIEEFVANTGLRLKMPARDLAEISRAALEGLFQLATIDAEYEERYRGLIERLFVLLAESMAEPAGEE